MPGARAGRSASAAPSCTATTASTCGSASGVDGARGRRPARGGAARRRHARRRRRRGRRARRDPEHGLARRVRARRSAAASCATRRSPRATPRTSSPPATSRPGRTRWPTASAIRIEHWTNAAEQGAHAGAQRCSPRRRARALRGRPVLLVRPVRRQDPVRRPARARRARRHWSSRDGDRLGRSAASATAALVAAIAFNAPRRLPFYRRRSRMPPLEDVVAAVRADEKALARRAHEGAGPPARRSGPPGAARRVARGARHRRTRCTAPTNGEPMPDPRDYAFVASLGSPSARTTRTSPRSWTRSGLIGSAVEHDVPVLGLCFGGQVLAAVLGGRVEHAPAPELGWREIETDDPERDPRRSLAGVALRALHDAARRGRGGAHRRRRAGVPARAAPRRPVPPREHRRDRRPLGRHGRGEARRRSASTTAGRCSTAPEDERGRAGGARSALFDAFLETAQERTQPARPAGRSNRGSEGGARGPAAGAVRRVRDVRAGDLPRPARRGARQGRAASASSTAAIDHGLAFCSAVMGDRPAPHAGGRRRGGLPRPDRLARPRDADAAAVGARHGVLHRRPAARSASTRRPPTRAAPCAAPSPASRSSGYAPIVGPELEFFLCERDPDAPGGIRRYVDNLSMVYTVGPQADPRGVVREIAEALLDARAWARSPPTTSS